MISRWRAACRRRSSAGHLLAVVVYKATVNPHKRGCWHNSTVRFPAAAEGTNRISMAHLQSAAAGQLSAPLADVLAAICAGGRGLSGALGRLSRVGHSSGWDCLAGVALTCTARWPALARNSTEIDIQSRALRDSTLSIISKYFAIFNYYMGASKNSFPAGLIAANQIQGFDVI